MLLGRSSCLTYPLACLGRYFLTADIYFIDLVRTGSASLLDFLLHAFLGKLLCDRLLLVEFCLR